MSSRSAYALALSLAAVTLTACGSSSTAPSPTASLTPTPTDGPSTTGSMPPIRTSPFPTVSVNANDPTIVQCTKDVTTVTNATELFNRERGYYAPDMRTLVKLGYLTSVPGDVRYGYDAPDIDPVVTGTVAGC